MWHQWCPYEHHNPILVPVSTASSNISASGVGVVGAGGNQTHHQTLPLKSNLKKPSGGSNTVTSSGSANTSSQKLQWNQPTTSRSSLEELRV
jgi:hypothetical protein